MNKMELVHTIKAHVPKTVLEAYHSAKRYCVWKLQQRAYYKAVDIVRMKKEPIRVLFIVNDSAMWKYDSLYRLMKEDPVFLPQILVCPTITYITKLQAQEKLQSTFDVFSNRGYSVIKATEDVSLNGVSVASLRPDIVFYSYLWTSSIEAQYDVHALRDYLKCYVNYGFSNTAGEWGYASAFHGLMWRYFAECEDVRSIALQAQPREMRNIVVTGYPIYDEYGEILDEGHDTIKYKSFTSDDYYKIHIKEYWYIDKQDTRMKVRIVSLALVDENCKEVDGEMECNPTTRFWIPMNDMRVRNIFSRTNAYDLYNNNAERSYDEIFISRYFDSYVTRETNVHNREIHEYLTGEDSQLESQTIEERIFDIESDMWEY